MAAFVIRISSSRKKIWSPGFSPALYVSRRDASIEILREQIEEQGYEEQRLSSPPKPEGCGRSIPGAGR
jgi:hypothetical protein